MAIYSFNAKVISRSAGQSAVATAAYNARQKLTDERTGEVKDYSRGNGLIFSGIYAPKDAPEWANDRAELWNHAEAAEKRKDATIARNYLIALPHELTDEQRRYAVQDFIKENFTRKGYVADCAIHAPDKNGDDRNYHAHILVTDRRLEADGFAADKTERQGTKKERADKLEIEKISWEKIGNRHLERHGFEPTLDHRSLEAQGLDRAPTLHRGVDVTAMERRGIETDRGDEGRQIEARNAELKSLQIEAAKLEREIRQAELEEKAKKHAAHEAATLYDRAGLVSQQADALRDHAARQKILDQANDPLRPEEPTARILREERESQNPQLKADRLQAEALQRDRAEWQKQHAQEKYPLKPEHPESRIHREKLESENPELKDERLENEAIKRERVERQREKFAPKPEHPEDRAKREAENEINEDSEQQTLDDDQNRRAQDNEDRKKRDEEALTQKKAEKEPEESTFDFGRYLTDPHYRLEVATQEREQKAIEKEREGDSEAIDRGQERTRER